MCLHPVKILNKSNTFIHGLDKKFISVPCGKCPECQRKRSNDVFVRSYFEYELTKKCKGFAVLYTLTYSDSHLPFCTSRHIPCFSREDITNFFKRLRQRLCRKYGLSSSDLRYLLVCEYGGLRQRPHYHCIFFVNNSLVTPAVFKFCVIQSWKKGYVSTTKINDGVLVNVSGIAYVSKYVSKDTNTSKFFASQLNWLRVNSPSEVDDLKKHMPFTRRSLHYGEYAFYTDSDFRIDYSNLRDREIFVPDYNIGVRKFSLPLYYVRKALYTSYVEFVYDDKGKKVWKTSYFLNDLGKSLRNYHIEKYIDASRRLFHSAYARIDVSALSYLNKKFCSSFDLVSFRSEVLALSDNFSKDFLKFVNLIAPYYEYSSMSEYDNLVGSSPDFDLIQSLELKCIDMKESYFNFLHGSDIDISYDCCQSYLLSSLVSFLRSSSSVRFMRCLRYFDVLFEYFNSIDYRKGVEFEYSALYRKYVFNY